MKQSTKPEQKLWHRMRDGAKDARNTDPLLKHMHLVRIENAVGAGKPDVDICVNGRDGCLELKSRLELPARADTPVFTSKGLRDDQILWIYHRCKAGGRVFVAAEAGPYLFLQHMSTDNVREYNTYTLAQLHWNAQVVFASQGTDWTRFYQELGGVYD